MLVLRVLLFLAHSLLLLISKMIIFTRSSGRLLSWDLYHGLPQTHSSHPLDILAWLGQQEILDLAFVRDCQQALTNLYRQRIVNADTAGLTNELKQMKETVFIPLGMLLSWLSQDKPLSQRLHPGYWPEANGKRYLTLREERRWQEALQQNYIASTPSKGLPEIKIKTIHCGEGYLHAQVIQQLQTGGWMKASGEFNIDAKNSSKTKGRHLVIPLTLGDFSLYIKIFPEMPGMEYAASRLAQLLVGFGLPLVEIARIEVGKTVYPVLLSQSISGSSLDEALKVRETVNLSLEPRSFSEMMLLNLFLSPEDGKPDNFILTRRRSRTGEPRLRLVNVDNDRSFYPAVIEEGENQFTVMVKTIVYCFDEMQSVFDPNLAKELQALEPFELLQEWLKQLAIAETALTKLFYRQRNERSVQRANDKYLAQENGHEAGYAGDKLNPDCVTREVSERALCPFHPLN